MSSGNKISVHEISKYFDRLLNLNGFKSDHSNNGLQVEASANVDKIAFAVDASLKTFNAASKSGAQLLVVHHGISWGSEPRRFTGMVAKRLNCLFAQGISLYAVHLPLDGHPELGHNACIGKQLLLTNRRMFCEHDGADIGVAGELPKIMKVAELIEALKPIAPEIRVYGNISGSMKNIGVVSGGGGIDAIVSAVEAELDGLITGEITHQDYHYAEESGIAVLALGHYKSEIPGLLAVKRQVELELGIECVFIDCATGL